MIRHGDPDYENDTLTEKGRREAALLAKAASGLNLGTCFVSPLGRARDTAAYCLEQRGLTVETFDWLEEFPAKLDLKSAPGDEGSVPERQDEGRNVCAADASGICFRHTGQPMRNILTGKKWRESEVARCSDLVERYDEVVHAFDGFLEKHGYVREKRAYTV